MSLRDLANEQSKRGQPTLSNPATSLIELMALASELEWLTQEYKEIDDEQKVRKARIEELRKQVLPELMEAAGLVGPDGTGRFTLKSGASVYLRTDLYANVATSDKPALLAWLKANGFRDIVKEDVHPQTLRAFAREQTEAGTKLPPQLSVYLETAAVLKKG
jgi:hypothetical protein